MIRTVMAAVVVILGLLAPGSAGAQNPDSQQQLPMPVPPPLPPKPPPKDAPMYQAIVPDSDKPWGLTDDLLGSLQSKVKVYQAYARRFTCNEQARVASYDETGDVSKEKVKEYGYLLRRDPMGTQFSEFRQPIAKDGKLKSSPVKDEEPFPPAYAWVFLFSSFHEPYFEFRKIRTEFEGFDLVHEIQFKGSLPFTNGKDIRQWEGKVLVDAFTYTPIEIIAEPNGQRDRIAAIYRQWQKSFNVMGFRTKQPPLGYRAHIQFRFRRDGLTFPTELRYDTNKAVSASQIVSVKASTRSYSNYLFTEVTPMSEIGEVVQP